MLETVFFRILNMSGAATVVILLVLLARVVLSRASHGYAYALWSVVLFRLLCPVSFHSALSLLPRGEAVTTDILYTQTPTVRTGLTFVDRAVNAVLPAPSAGGVASVNPLQVVAFVAEWLWLIGVCVMLLASAVSLLRLVRRLKNAVRISDNVYTAERIDTPFVLGVWKPRIYLPADLAESERAHILLHEQMHIRRGDPICKVLGFLALSLHWFNPFVWVAWRFAVRDMEMSCDEAVIRRLGSGVKKAYSTSLLSFSTGGLRLGGEPLAFGEGDAKSRIRNVLNFRKPAAWIAILAAVAAAVLIFTLASNPNESAAQAVPVSPDEETPRALEVTFPAYQGGRTEYNGEIYDALPVVMTAALPDGWSAAIPTEDEQVFTEPSTPVGIYNERGEYVGYVGFGVFEPYEGEIPPEDYYKTVYPTLRLGSLSVWDDYTPLVTTDDAETALCTVRSSVEEDGKSAAEWATIEAPGILSYDKTLGEWVAFYFEPDALTSAQQEKIARSITLSRAA